jgi:hypothetical protein
MGRLLEPDSDARARLMIGIRETGNRTRLTGLLLEFLSFFSKKWKRGLIFLLSHKLKNKNVVEWVIRPLCLIYYTFTNLVAY